MKRIPPSPLKVSVLSMAVSCIALFSSPAHATLLVYDDFTGNGVNGASLIGTTPPTTINGRQWIAYNGIGAVRDTSIGTPSPSARINGANAGLAIDITSVVGFYTKPTVLTISADILVGEPTNPLIGTVLGFKSLAESHTHDYFTGLALTYSGDLILYVPNGNALGTLAYSGPGFNPNVFHSLAYTIDTITGGISGITLDGNSAGSFSATPFTDSATKFAVIGASYFGTTRVPNFDNFTLQTIPEPSVPLLLMTALSATLFIRRHKQRHP